MTWMWCVIAFYGVLKLSKCANLGFVIAGLLNLLSLRTDITIPIVNAVLIIFCISPHYSFIYRSLSIEKIALLLKNATVRSLKFKRLQ